MSEVSGGSDHVYIAIHCARCASGETVPPFIFIRARICIAGGWWVVQQERDNASVNQDE